MVLLMSPMTISIRNWAVPSSFRILTVAEHGSVHRLRFIIVFKSKLEEVQHMSEGESGKRGYPRSKRGILAALQRIADHARIRSSIFIRGRSNQELVCVIYLLRYKELWGKVRWSYDYYYCHGVNSLAPWGAGYWFSRLYWENSGGVEESASDSWDHIL